MKQNDSCSPFVARGSALLGVSVSQFIAATIHAKAGDLDDNPPETAILSVGRGLLVYKLLSEDAEWLIGGIPNASWMSYKDFTVVAH